MKKKSNKSQPESRKNDKSKTPKKSKSVSDVDMPKWASKKMQKEIESFNWDELEESDNTHENDKSKKNKERNTSKKSITKAEKISVTSKSKTNKFTGKTIKKSYRNNKDDKADDGTIRLNKYIANAGICSRREADELIKAGAVSVNGKIITEMGYKVKPGDVVNYGGQTIRQERKVYILLNKPKDYITTVDDPQKRKTVLDLIKGACKERVYPVGRLDRNTTGLLLLTNDGDLAKKLTHPSSGVKKIYHVVTDKSVSKQDLIKLTEGLRLEDGFVKADNADYVETANSKKEIGIELHSGKNRIVRRMMEHLGYKVVKLDRVVFAGLTKKDLPRGRWRFLTEKEIGMLKMLPS